MIIFDLTCNDNHRFEGWFRSAEDFVSQQARGFVTCPQCGSDAVRRLPSVLHVGSAHQEPSPQGQSASSPSSSQTVHPLAVLKAVVEQIVSNSEDVGTRFAEEARKIHYQESPSRPIRGQATSEDCSALKEEGIDVLHIPLVKPEDLN